ncbi:major allergen I polypeptide chain 2 isoform X2 [Ailuropoda melanoleuca]|uniref:major allergen I polypeptide chain 2 isoform X2 n=1 Tax=Ailuropoda melanoleuca TaxID=9646 RepID=UPI0014946F45|nr:major allergen I polypeptide chain 2 isoform X2 [Ailuropoda melanoleuca]
MKGTLVVLALLVTQELGIEMVKSCPIFYIIFGSVAGGSKSELDINLDLVNATKPEKEALEKIQDCYNEKGLKAKALDLDVMATITTSKQCRSEAVAPWKSAVATLRR